MRWSGSGFRYQAIGMRVEAYSIQKHRGWVRLHEKGGNVTELPCHHNLDRYLKARPPDLP